MKKSLLICTILFVLKSFGQQNPSITKVENNLMPYVTAKGFKKWNIVDRMKYYNIAGASVVAIKNYKIDFAKSYGLADTANKIKATNETIYSAGSISKLVTAVIVLKMVDEGKLNLDENVNNYLTSWKVDSNDFTKKKPITLRLLLSHKAGASQSAYWGFEPTAKTLPTITQILNGDKIATSNKVIINSEPNKEWRYSGGGYMIVQMILMDVLKKDFESIAQKYVFKPLGMSNSTFSQPLPKEFQQKFSNGYSNATWYKGTPYVYPQQAAAGLHTTAIDLAKLIITIQKSLVGNSTYLSQTIAKIMVTPQVQISSGGYLEQMGVGAFLLEKVDNKNDDGRFFEHQGSNAGFISYAMGSVTNGNGAIILVNNGDDFNGFCKELRRSIAKVYNWNNFNQTPITTTNLDSKSLEQFVGRYRKGINEVVTIKKENNYLTENINKGNIIYAFPIKKDTIIFSDFNIKGFFNRDVNNRIIGLRTEYDRPENVWKKMLPNEYAPFEYLERKEYEKAKEGYRAMNMNEYQITYLAYELSGSKNADFTAVKTILELAKEQHPNSSIVYSSWGKYYEKINDIPTAIINYKKALDLDPNDEVVKENLRKLYH